ncbi:MAG: peptidoglycan DD-metalloendopeptidase family protein [Prevotella sp.]|nr:peptidoglycan DD-metalloendopeptidase family protein [Prevotella sp.]
MTFKKVIKTFLLTSIFTFTTQNVAGQDLLARQAPVDHKAKAVEQMALKNLTAKENLENPSSDLYLEWENKRTHAVYALPDQYKIDLRGFHMPTPSRVITSNFGRRWGRQHKGLDIKVYIGDTIRAAFSGKVRVVRYEGNGYGNYVVIRHNNGLETVYGHMSRQLVRENQQVRAGQPIGLGGNTGRSTGSHLHFETRLCGVALNPALMFDFRNQDVTGDFYTFRKSTNEAESLQATRLRGKNDDHGYTKADVQGTTTNNQQQKQNASAPKTSEPTAARSNEILWHTVGYGESLESIAQAHGITVEQLCRLNNIGRFTSISRGQHLRYQ